ncbi:MAG: FadR family transcriptional regulator [Magnetovibrio sp.]|nr:FadR family transcriptional regulator [Magnetovibrio sp.]
MANHINLNAKRLIEHKIDSNLGKRTYSARSLHGQVVHELGRRIVSGDIPEGSILPIETELGAEFDVSRTALREGIKVLTAKGLLVSRTRTGTRVRPRSDWNMLDPDILVWRLETKHDREFIQDLFDFRSAIEPMAASLAAKRATDEEIIEMKLALVGMREAKNSYNAHTEYDLRFHLLILSCCRNEFLASLFTLVETAIRFTFELIDYQVDQDLTDIHTPILKAIQARDGQAAHDAMLEHLKYSHELNTTILAKMDAE